MIINEDTVIFESTGREDYANGGIIGITKSINGELLLSEGYDGGFGEYSDELNKKEKIELAKYMINIWQEFKRNA